MTDIPQLSEIKETFALLDQWEDRYAYLIDLGRKLPPYPEDKKTDLYLVKGCTSQVWMILDNNNERLTIQADSDAHIVRGLIALVMTTYNDIRLGDIQSVNMEEIFQELGLADHLSPNRRNGFFAMVNRIQNISA